MAGILFRALRRWYRHRLLIRSHENLRLDPTAEVIDTKLGRSNLICVGAVLANSSLGDFSYASANCRISNADVGKFCSIGPSVIIAPGRHPTGFASTHPIFYSSAFDTRGAFIKETVFEEHQRVTIGHDVWLGARATVLDGVNIGTGAVVAAHSVVNADVAPYAIVGGSPAKLIRPRFAPDVVERLLKSCWWDCDVDRLQSSSACFLEGFNPDEIPEADASMRLLPPSGIHSKC
ncbi:MAG: CatB-related O-acetyltransferase [Planctomycetota bacterium]